ncbi:hypothetical protein XELAEV_18009668mg, partial [Xenopus laevis]
DDLRKMITILALKNEEIQNFIYNLKQMTENVEENSTRVQGELEGEFQSLYSLLDDLKEGMLMKIKQERASRIYELQNQLTACTKALESSEELLETANHTIVASETDGFSQVPHGLVYLHKLITMAPAFRLSLKAKVTDNMSHLMVDFTQERSLLQNLHFLPVPSTPEIIVPDCCVVNNSISLVWSMPDGEDSGIQHYVLEHRKNNFPGPPRAKEEQPWMVVEGIQGTEHTLTSQRFDMKYMNFRVKACNKAVSGDFSEPVTLETPGIYCYMMIWVVWSVQSPKRMPSARVGRDRFTAESYTVLGDTLIDGGECYWEVRFDKDSKAFAVGVTYRSLGKFDQLGKTSASWCLHLNNWLQVTFAAKHGNKARILDAAIPNRIGLHCNYDEGFLSFYNATNKQLLHTFRMKFTQPVLPAFMVWCGNFSVNTGLQVPSCVKSLQKRNSATSSSSTSLT